LGVFRVYVEDAAYRAVHCCDGKKGTKEGIEECEEKREQSVYIMVHKGGKEEEKEGAEERWEREIKVK
jgi:hypothetical protein